MLARQLGGCAPSTSTEARKRKYSIYEMADMQGSGDLLNWMRYARKTGDFSLVDGFIESAVKDAMYSGGKGRLESVAELVKRRNEERNENLGAFRRRKGTGKSGPNILDHFNQENNQGDLNKALKLLEGSKGVKGDAKFREIVWKLEERGTMGENLVGCCLLQGTIDHNDLVILDYYGLSPLHQSIVNSDLWLTNFLLQNGADVNQRCYGALFCPDDQKDSRTDSLEHEYVDLGLHSSYTGKLYYGEYALAFAACTDQKEFYRLLTANKANPNSQDTNGNAVLHMAVIHENMEMFQMVYENGGKLQILNKQNLTPLTLAAKLAKKNMFEQILQIISIKNWNYGHASSVAYPLAEIDTINEETGKLNKDSALSLIVYGEKTEHLELLDGFLEDLLTAKWKAFGRKRWYLSFTGFIVYYFVFVVAFMTRPITMTTSVITGVELNKYTETSNTYDLNSTCLETKTWFDQSQCHLLKYSDFGIKGYVRLFCEPLIIIMAVYQVVSELLDIRNIGKNRWWQVLKSFPSKILYKTSFVLVLFIVPIRCLCFLGIVMLLLENMIALVCVILTTVHFLYYCRAIKFVGPFILMIYTIIMQDMIKFFLIYLIFLTGFSQGFSIIFHSCERARADMLAQNMSTEKEETVNIFSSPAETIIRLFLMTIIPIAPVVHVDFYRQLSNCQSPMMSEIAKLFYLLFQTFVSLLQFNLLIAAMRRTYDVIYSTQMEWKRQWAQVILMLELSLSPESRLTALLHYSRPIGTDKSQRAFVVNKKIESNTETYRLFKTKIKRRIAKD
uniref:Uncharacterized protein n=1 Tax=Ditylenchus dipsaci TaxID=166011 RepID=A0A915CYT0_9BILA